MWKKRRLELPEKGTGEITAYGDPEALEVGWVVECEALPVEAWCRNQDLEWEGELLQGSEFFFTDLHAAVQTPLLQNGEFLHPSFGVLQYGLGLIILLTFVPFYFLC